MTRGIAALLVGLLGGCSAPAARGPAAEGERARPALAGRVTSGGTPVAGASVLIYTARVREGTSPFCPSCYADCGKRDATDAGGRFAIPSLDPGLVFRVLVLADGYTPRFL